MGTPREGKKKSRNQGAQKHASRVSATEKKKRLDGSSLEDIYASLDLPPGSAPQQASAGAGSTRVGRATVATSAPTLHRIAAFAVDILALHLIVFSPIVTALLAFLPEGVATSPAAMNRFLNAEPSVASVVVLLMAFCGLLAIAYFALLEHFGGQTLGKMLFRLRTVRSASDAGRQDKDSPGNSSGSGIGFGQALVRSLFFIPIFPFTLLLIADPAFMLFTRERRRLLERISGTTVVSVAAGKTGEERAKRRG